MEFYVYIHRKKTNGEVFYVGKGNNKRAWDKKGRSSWWKKVEKKHGRIVEIVQTNLQEWYAFELEKELIAFYGRKDCGYGSLVNMSDGGESPSGLDSCASDKKDYTFYNFKTEETFTGKRLTFRSIYNINVDPLFSRKTLRKDASVQGWVLLQGKSKDDLIVGNDGLMNSNADTSFYTFLNLDSKETITSTRHEFTKRTGVKTNTLFSNLKTYKRWIVYKGQSEEELKFLAYPEQGKNNPRADNNIYVFVHKNGDKFSGTRLDFEHKYGIKIYHLFGTSPCKTCKGWRLAEPINP